MIKVLPLLAMLFVAGIPQMARAASEIVSLDCEGAETPFERAICDSPVLTDAHDLLRRTFETASGGLSKSALNSLRADQRVWLDYAQKACTPDAKPMVTGTYDDQSVSCLMEIFSSRNSLLETSRMIKGLRFYPYSRYAALPDPDAEENQNTYWRVARHEQGLVQLDATVPYAKAFNDFVRAQADIELGLFAPQGGVEDAQMDDSSDTDNSITAHEIATPRRISLKVNTYWYGHGAAHGNYSITYLHYLIDENRALAAEDIFAGEGWQKALIDLALAALKAEHGEDNLMLDDTKYVEESIVDPTRWDISDAYGLIIQFQPYEVAPYAYGAPSVKISWEALSDHLAESAEEYRYGY